MLYAPETFTEAEAATLRPYFTNLDGPVFALTNLPEVVKGALFTAGTRAPTRACAACSSTSSWGTSTSPATSPSTRPSACSAPRSCKQYVPGGQGDGAAVLNKYVLLFYVNAYDLKARPRWALASLALHEAAPGHHFQISLQRELSELPMFRRFSRDTAYIEGGVGT